MVSVETWKEGLTAKEASTVLHYCNPDSETYNNWCKSYLKAKYSDCKGYERNALKVRQKYHIEEAIRQYRAKTGQIWAHDRQISIDGLNLNLLRAMPKADDGDIQAVGAITAIYKELDAISMLHGNKVETTTDSPEPITVHDQELLQQISQLIRDKELGPRLADKA